MSQIPSIAETPYNPVTWDFQLPPSVDAERLEVNVDRIKKITKVGYFLGHHIVGYQGEVTSVTPGIAGINQDGTAISSGVASVNKAPVSDSRIIDEYPGVPTIMRRYHRTTAVHKLNKSEIASRVVDRKRDSGVSSETAWAKELNSALAESIRDASSQHLLDRNKFPILNRIDATVVTLLGGNAVFDLVANSDTSFLIWFSATMGLRAAVDQGIRLLDNVESGLYGVPLGDKRNSLTFSIDYQIDRHLAVSALSRMGPLIRVAR